MKGFSCFRGCQKRQLRVRHVYKFISLGIEFIKSDVNLKLRLNVGGNAILRKHFQRIN